MRTSRSFLAFALAATLVFGVSGTSATAEPASAAPSVLTIISGSVLVRHPQADFAPAHDGDALAIGDTVRTEADSRAVLTMFEGSTVELEPGTEITIDDASKHADSTVVLFTQLLGRTWHVVTHLLTPDSRYNVKTPAATASVRGTAFEVAVSDRAGEVGATTVTTTNGAVATLDAAGTAEVLVTPATTTTVQPGAPPSAPRAAPAPDRVVTVTVSGASAIVTDPLGRGNGVKGGKVVIQTPGATVSVNGGMVTVSMPDVPDGQISTRVEGAANSSATVTTTVSAKGAAPSTTRADVTVGSDGSATTTIDVKATSQKDPAGQPAGDSGKGAAPGSANEQKAPSAPADQKAGSPSNDPKSAGSSNDQKSANPSNDQKPTAAGEQKVADQKTAEAKSTSTNDSKAAADASTDKQSKRDTSDKQNGQAKAEAPQPPPAKEVRGKPH